MSEGQEITGDDVANSGEVFGGSGTTPEPQPSEGTDPSGEAGSDPAEPSPETGTEADDEA